VYRLPNDRLKKDPKTAKLIPEITDKMLSRKAMGEYVAVKECVVKKKIITAYEKDPIYRKFFSIWQNDQLTATPVNIGLWIDLYNREFGKDNVKKEIRGLLSRYDREYEKNAREAHSKNPKWAIHWKLQRKLFGSVTSTNTVKSVDLSGKYIAKGTDPAGKKYNIKVIIKKVQPSMYNIQWSHPTVTFQTGTYYHNGKLIFGALGAPSVYILEPDGSISGERDWPEGIHRDRISERLVRNLNAAPSIEGNYHVTGVDRYGSAYKGGCAISETSLAEEYKFNCRKNHGEGINSVSGRGKKSGNIISVFWQSQHYPRMNFTINTDGSLHYVSENKKAHEKLARITKSEALPTIAELQGKSRLIGNYYGIDMYGNCHIWKANNKYYFRRHVKRTRRNPVVIMDGDAKASGDTLTVTIRHKNGTNYSLSYKIRVNGSLFYISNDAKQSETCTPTAYRVTMKSKASAKPKTQKPPTQTTSKPATPKADKQGGIKKSDIKKEHASTKNKTQKSKKVANTRKAAVTAIQAKASIKENNRIKQFEKALMSFEVDGLSLGLKESALKKALARSGYTLKIKRQTRRQTVYKWLF